MIYIFKTTVKTDEDIKKIKPKLNNLSASLKWNFDLEDCDSILRIEDSDISSNKIKDILLDTKFECQELE